MMKTISPRNSRTLTIPPIAQRQKKFKAYTLPPQSDLRNRHDPDLDCHSSHVLRKPPWKEADGCPIKYGTQIIQVSELSVLPIFGKV